MGNEILGRSPSTLEQRAIAEGFIPIFKVGDSARIDEIGGEGVVDAVVLFPLQGGYTWGCRIGGISDHYFPQDHLKAVDQK